MKLSLCLLALLVALGCAVAQETVTVSRKILLPDGKPAAGVKVIIRSFAQVKLLQEVEATTGQDGVVTATVQYRSFNTGGPQGPGGPTSYGYLVVDVPGCALAFGKLLAPKPAAAAGAPAVGPMPGFGAPTTGGGNKADENVLKLAPAYTQTGLVVDAATKQPVPNASVFVGSLARSVPVNIYWAGHTCKELVTTTNAEGIFTLRGVTAETLSSSWDSMPSVGGSTQAGMIAYATADGNVLGGENARFSFSPTPQATPQRIEIGPTTTLTGKVVDHAGKPVAGVKVRLDGVPQGWITCLPYATTDAEGIYIYQAITATERIYAFAEKEQYINGRVQAYARGRRMGQGDPLPPIAAPNLTIRALGPMVTVRAIDATTGKAPAVPMKLSVTLTEGIRDESMGWILGESTSAPMAANGTATIRMPYGRNEIRFIGPGYTGSGSVDIPCKDTPTLTMTRRTGILVHFVTDNPLGMKNVIKRMRTVDGKAMPFSTDPFGPDDYWFVEIHRQSPPGPYEVSATRGGVEVCPWTRVDPAVWPNEIRVK
ncbi:MAG TPA: hypothetical protein PLZ36_12700 [Armatimonadota bacterium]|nr:hypothetical protein [Armatimonadota bacterium]